MSLRVGHKKHTAHILDELLGFDHLITMYGFVVLSATRSKFVYMCTAVKFLAHVRLPGVPRPRIFHATGLSLLPPCLSVFWLTPVASHRVLSRPVAYLICVSFVSLALSLCFNLSPSPDGL